MIETVLMVLEVIVCIALIGTSSAAVRKRRRGQYFRRDGAGKGNDLDTLMAKATIYFSVAFVVITLALAKINA